MKYGFQILQTDIIRLHKEGVKYQKLDILIIYVGDHTSGKCWMNHGTNLFRYQFILFEDGEWQEFRSPSYQVDAREPDTINRANYLIKRISKSGNFGYVPSAKQVIETLQGLGFDHVAYGDNSRYTVRETDPLTLITPSPRLFE